MAFGQMAAVPVVFNYANWLRNYPQFGSVNPGQAQEFFNRATTLINNSPLSRIPYAPNASPPVETRLYILNAAVAHFACLETPDATGNVRPVGRISQAAEGSVNLSLEYMMPSSDNQAWWNQTTYGAYVWAATLNYRSARYVPGPQGRGGIAFGFGSLGRRGF